MVFPCVLDDKCPSCLEQDDIIKERQQKQHVEESFKSVDYITEDISYQDFFLRYLIPNKPCVLAHNTLTQHWPSRTQWVDHSGKPDFEFLNANFGKAKVPVAICNKKLFDSQPKTEQSLREYLEYWQDYICQGYPPQAQCLYLKDWHFVRKFPNYEAYQTPVYFCSDWLNEFWDTDGVGGTSDDGGVGGSTGDDDGVGSGSTGDDDGVGCGSTGDDGGVGGHSTVDDGVIGFCGCDGIKDDYRFVYMGPKGSWTPLHADVLHSYSWSANICGQKLWILFPPSEELCLQDKYGNLAYDVTSADLQDPILYPDYHKLSHRYRVVQNPGEIIFVPSGWHHQVWNTEDTISINHNWLNGCCIDLNWRFLKRTLEDVKAEISDCKDMEGWGHQCQVVLKSLTGSSFEDFYRLCRVIASRRLPLVCGQEKQQVSHSKPDGSHTSQQGNSQGGGEEGMTDKAAAAAVVPCPDHRETVELTSLEVMLPRRHFVPIITTTNTTDSRTITTTTDPTTTTAITPSKCHAVFDLHRLRNVLQDMVDTTQGGEGELPHIEYWCHRLDTVL
ncbi:2-oxoglutarate and iron-dependent oxygenase JMJD4-like [Argonauta hians]